MLGEYIVSVIKIVTLGAVMLSLSHVKMKKSASLVMGVVISAAILLPLVDLIKDNEVDLPTFDDYETLDVRDDTVESAYENGLKEYIASDLGVDIDCVDVFVDEFDFSSMRAGRIYVTLRGAAIYADYRRLEEKIQKEFTNNGKCEVKIVVG